MKNFAIMDMFKRETYLDEPIEYLFLIELLACRFLLGYFGVHIPSICEVHHNAQTSSIHKALSISHDIGMPHCFEHVDFVKCFFFLFPLHS